MRGFWGVRRQCAERSNHGGQALHERRLEARFSVTFCITAAVRLSLLGGGARCDLLPVATFKKCCPSLSSCSDMSAT